MERIKKENKNTTEYWDKVYNSEIDKGIRRDNFDRFSAIEKLLPEKGKILEIGCGKGEFFEYLRNKRAFDYTGVDISKEVTDYNSNRFSDAKFMQNNPGKLKFQDGLFDVVISIEVLEHVENLEVFASEAKRVLKVGGKFIAITPHKNKIDSAEHIWSFTLDGINNLFVSSRNIVADPYLLVDWTKQSLVVDFDDFSEKNNRMDLLNKLKEIIPNLKVTLFTVPNDCTKEFCQKISKLDWVDLALHGDTHTHLECSVWTKEKALEVLNKYEEWGCFVKVFKPPFWAGSEGLYEALSEKNYILAQTPKAVIGDNLVYRLNANSVHGHIQNVCNNGLEEKFNYYKLFKGHDFKFIKELYE